MMKIYSPLSLTLFSGSNANSGWMLLNHPAPSPQIRGLGVFTLPEPPYSILWWKPWVPVPAGDSVNYCDCRAHCWAYCHLGWEPPLSYETWILALGWVWIEALYTLLRVRSKKGFKHKNRTLTYFRCFQSKALMHNPCWALWCYWLPSV